jgi:hypothetical protein
VRRRGRAFAIPVGWSMIRIKWEPVSREDHAQIKRSDHDPIGS